MTNKEKTLEELVSELNNIIEKFEKETSFSILGLKLNGKYILMLLTYWLLFFIFK